MSDDAEGDRQGRRWHDGTAAGQVLAKHDDGEDDAGQPRRKVRQFEQPIG